MDSLSGPHSQGLERTFSPFHSRLAHFSQLFFLICIKLQGNIVPRLRNLEELILQNGHRLLTPSGRSQPRACQNQDLNGPRPFPGFGWASEHTELGPRSLTQLPQVRAERLVWRKPRMPVCTPQCPELGLAWHPPPVVIGRQNTHTHLKIKKLSEGRRQNQD